MLAIDIDIWMYSFGKCARHCVKPGQQIKNRFFSLSLLFCIVKKTNSIVWLPVAAGEGFPIVGLSWAWNKLRTNQYLENVNLLHILLCGQYGWARRIHPIQFDFIVYSFKRWAQWLFFFLYFIKFTHLCNNNAVNQREKFRFNFSAATKNRHLVDPFVANLY